MSQVPRPWYLRSFKVSVQGSVSHGWPSTGTTSVWPDSTTPSFTLGPTVAKRLAFLPSSLGTSFESMPWSSRYFCTYSINARLELREVVSNATRRRSISTEPTISPAMMLLDCLDRCPTDHGQEFASCLAIIAEGTQHAAGHHGDIGLVDAAGGHALVRRLDDDGDAARLQDFLQGVGDLRRELLLDLQAEGEGVDHAGELADADDAVVRQVADMDPADDPHHVVVA